MSGDRGFSGLIPARLRRAGAEWVCLLWVGAYVLGQGAPDLVPDPSGATAYRVPRGWQIQHGQSGGVPIWAARADDHPQAAGLLVVVLPDGGGALDQLMEPLLAQTAQDVRILERRSDSPNEAHYRLAGRIGQAEARLALVLVRDPGRHVFFCLFAAGTDDYRRLGGEDLLYRCLQRPNPFARETDTRPAEVSRPSSGPRPAGAEEALNLQNRQVQQAILDGSRPLVPPDLHGEWVQAVGRGADDVYREVGSGSLVYGGWGHAHVVRFQPDGTYVLTYVYQITDYGRENSVHMTEAGRWDVRGPELQLTRARYHGTYDVFGKISQRDETGLPARTFRVGVTTDGRSLVWRGAPFEYTITSDAEITLGFVRVK